MTSDRIRELNGNLQLKRKPDLQRMLNIADAFGFKETEESLSTFLEEPEGFNASQNYCISENTDLS